MRLVRVRFFREEKLARCIVALCAVLAILPASAAEKVQLAADGKAAMPLILSANASPRVQQAARSLADYLHRITDAPFEVKTGDGKAGIVVGLASDFPGAISGEPLNATEPTHREDYILRCHPTGLLILGASDIAVEDAVWDLLYRLGYRQFFPGEHWEEVPHVRNLSTTVDVREHPAYYARRIWFGYGPWDYASQPYTAWCAKNRAVSGLELSSGHSYDGFLKANKAEFVAHPEYLGLVNGQRKSTKFCISNPGLRKLIVESAIRHFDKNPALDSVSTDPSDGGGWCECAECAKLGSVTDRALLLANEVAAGVNAKYPGKLVGMYAYAFHSPPPSIQANPRVVISIATAFIKGGLTIDDLMTGWSAKASLLGIREYYSVNTWDRDLPAAARGGNIAYLKRTIPEFHGKGARFMSAESSDNWAPNGLGYYLASRMLWDVREAARTDELIEDFLSRAFGPAKAPMREFYQQLDGSQPHLMPSDQLGRMFRSIEAALRLSDSPRINARLVDLLLYCRYVDLYSRYSHAQGEPRQQAFEALIRHAYRMRTTMMVHTKGLYRDLAGRDKSVKVPANATWNVPEGKNPWKSSEPFAPPEVLSYLKEGIERYPLAKLDFKPIAFGGELVHPTQLKLPEVPRGTLGASRGMQTFYTQVDTAPATIELQITGGLIAHYRDRGNVRINLIKIGGASQTGERETPVAEDHSVPPDGAEHKVQIPLKESGFYKLTIEDGSDRTLVEWPPTQALTIKSTLDEPMSKNYSDLWQLYFYVPKGTKTLGFFGGEHGEVRDSANRPVFWLNGREPNYYSIDVPDGEDGKLWSFRYTRGSVRLLTVPPYLARSSTELLLPSDVVKKDAAP